MPDVTAPRIPLSVIGGFLGAGKTTLLNHWLRHARGQRVAVLVNDFGALNIDAELIDAHAGGGDALVRLTNGCVCCQIGDDLTMALIRVLDGGSPPDAVVIEASGVSDPWRIAQMGRADPRLRLDGVIVLVDATAVLSHARDPLLADTLQRQIRSADLIVVNKAESVDGAVRAEIQGWIGSVGTAVPLFEATQAQVPMVLLSSHALRVPPPDAGHRHGDEAAHAHTAPDHGVLFETWSCRPGRAFGADALRDWLRAVPAGVLRLKGIVRTGSSEWSELQFAGRHGSLRACVPPQHGAGLVAIGLNGRLPRAELQSVFDRRP